MMEKYLDKKVFLEIQSCKDKLVYTAIITEVTSTHVTFVDKFGDTFSFRISDVIQVKELNEE